MEIVACPQINTDMDTRCNLLAEITDRSTMESTDGPIEHMSTRCLGRHTLTNFPAEMLQREAYSTPNDPKIDFS